MSESLRRRIIEYQDEVANREQNEKIKINNLSDALLKLTPETTHKFIAPYVWWLVTSGHASKVSREDELTEHGFASLDEAHKELLKVAKAWRGIVLVKMTRLDNRLEFSVHLR